MGGQVVRIGNATLYCCDALQVIPTLGNVAAVITDPPYGIPHEFGMQNKLNGKRTMSFAWDGPGVNECVFEAARLSTALAQSAFWFCGLRQASYLAEIISASGMTDKPAAWVKTCPPPALLGNWWPSGYEIAVFGYRPKAYFNDANTKRSNVFVSDSYRHGQPGKEDHPTQKPLGLMTKIVSALVAPEATALDCFMGSGSTGVACAMLGRAFVGIEIDDRYFALACERIERAQRQAVLFPPEPMKAHEQMTLEAALV